MPTLNWIGREAVVNHHREVPYHLLRCDEKLSVGDPGSGNLLVQGDNLLALKALLPYYAGQVKCIYIAPPYNTGNENWVYNDNANAPEIQKWLGKVVGSEAEDLSRHDKWLCMMYPRLALLREFLRSDGVIFISIDEHEVGHLRLMMDEVFGNANALGTLVWKRRSSSAIRGTPLSIDHEYVLAYAHDAPSATMLGLSKGVEGYAQMLLPECDTPLEVSPELCFRFPLNQYPAPAVYDGPIRFNKHYYELPADMNQAEAQCAAFIDSLPEVEFWVRNLECDQYAFWLQTSTDKFYLDFVVKLRDGRFLAVEYKGGHLETSADTEEKDAVGQLWAARSKERCAFLMATKRNLEEALRRRARGIA